MRSTKWLAGAAVGVIAANLAAFHLSPGYRSALADAPVFGHGTVALLQELGLAAHGTGGEAVGVNPEVTPLAASATVRSIRVGLAAGYADTIRTILILGTPNGLTPFDSGPDQMTLTDQAGHSYRGLLGGSGGGETILDFPPLPGASGGRVTLTIPAMYTGGRQGWQRGPLVSVPGYPPGTKGEFPAPVVTGPWTLTFDLSVAAGSRLAAPASRTVDGTTYTITDIRKSGPYLDIEWNATGAAVAREVADARAGRPQQRDGGFMRAMLYSPSGALIDWPDSPRSDPSQGRLLTGGGSLEAPFLAAHSEYLYRVGTPGTYRLVLGSKPSVTFEIDVS